MLEICLWNILQLNVLGNNGKICLKEMARDKNISQIVMVKTERKY